MKMTTRQRQSITIGIAVIIILLSVGFTLMPQTGDYVGQNGIADLKKMKYGIMIHYVAGVDGKTGTIYADGRAPTTVNEVVNSFNTEQYANDLESYGVDYAIITAWHLSMVPLFPNNTTIKYRTGDLVPARDLIGDIIAKLKAKGIKVYLYTHPTDGHDIVHAPT